MTVVLMILFPMKMLRLQLTAAIVKIIEAFIREVVVILKEEQ